MTAKNFNKKTPMGIAFHGKNVTATFYYDNKQGFKQDVERFVKP